MHACPTLDNHSSTLSAFLAKTLPKFRVAYGQIVICIDVVSPFYDVPMATASLHTVMTNKIISLVFEFYGMRKSTFSREMGVFELFVRNY